MKLYHGTSPKVARESLTKGLKPRGKDKSNWEHSSASNPHMIYLSSVYGPYFAMCATKTKDKLGLIEVDTELLDNNLLRPDEDFIEQATRTKNSFELKGRTIEERTNDASKRIDEFDWLWENSVNFLGNCGYKGEIPYWAITRVSIVNLESVPHLRNVILNPTITIANYKFCRKMYEALTEYCFGKSFEVAEFMSIQNHGLSELDSELQSDECKKMFNTQRKIYTSWFKKQNEVVTILTHKSK